MTKHEFLEKYIYTGLTNLNDGFDAPSIWYFSADHFEIVLQRIQRYKCGVLGLEPWVRGKNKVQYFDCRTYESTGKKCTSDWYLEAFGLFKVLEAELLYSATYFVPEELLADKEI